MLLWLLVLSIALLSILLVLAIVLLAILLILGIALLLAVLAVSSSTVPILAVLLAWVESLRTRLERLCTGHECVSSSAAVLEVQTLLSLLGQILIVSLILP